MTVEEAKLRLLNPPAEAATPSWASRNAHWLVLAAAGAGFMAARPGRMGKFAGRAIAVATLPLVKTAVLAFVTKLGRQDAAH